MLPLQEARSRILAHAAPLESIEIALSEAVGLVLAEPLAGDVDLPPFERAAFDGYAVRAEDVALDQRLRLVGSDDDEDEPPPRGRASIRGRSPRRSRRRAGGGLGLIDEATADDLVLEPGEAARVGAGSPLPIRANAILAPDDARLEAGVGAGHVLIATRPVAAGDGVISRGEHLRAGAALAGPGERLRLPMVSLLAAQGCVHPVCHRRVRVAVLAVGDHLVGPGEAPVMHRERNATGLTAVAPCLQWGATAHDLGAVGPRGLHGALDRALTAPVVITVGEPGTAQTIRRAWRRAGIEAVFSGLALETGARLSYGIHRHGLAGDGLPETTHHVFHMAEGPVGVLTLVTLMVGPLIARLQGGSGSVPGASGLRAVWSGAREAATHARGRVVPVTLEVDTTARVRAERVTHRGDDDLAGFARAQALALLPAGAGPWSEGDLVEVVPLGPWPNAA